MFDISTLEISDSAKWHVTDAAGKPQYDGDTPITITIHGPGTKKGAEAQFNYARKRQERSLAQLGGKVIQWTEADERRERAAFLAEITASLDGFDYRGGAPALYAAIKLPHVADGVQKTFNELGNFNGSSATDALNTSGMLPG